MTDAKVYVDGNPAQGGKKRQNRKLRETLQKYDADKNGVIDVNEIEDIVQDLIEDHNKVEVLKWIVGGVFVVLCLLLLSQTLLTAWLLEITKETKVGDNNELVAADGTATVITEKPRYYITVPDIPALPISALNSLNEISFSTVDGALHNYRIGGTKVDTSTELVYLYFGDNKYLTIENGAGTLSTKNAFTGVVTDVAVALDSATSVNSRRLAMIEEAAHGEDTDLMHRCSITEGLCYHTYSEIQQLHQSGRRGLIDVVEDNAVNEGTVTYAEVNADLSILSTDSRSSLTQASSFLAGLLGANLTAAAKGTTSIFFVMKERCVNYPDLAGTCDHTPAPTESAATGNANLSVTSAFDTLRPYPGLHVEDSKWGFVDEIEYNKDAYTIQLKVRYSHDSLRESRRHVVMMDRINPEHIISYDEVTTMTDPENPLHTYLEAETFITNFQSEDITSVDSGGASGEILTRRLQASDDIFHAHMRTKIRGFPDVFIHEAIVGKDIRKSNERRLTADDDYNDLDEIVTLETVMTTSHANSLLDVSNATEAKAKNIYNETEADMFTNDVFLNQITHLPVQIHNLTYSSSGATQPPDLAEPEATFGGLTITTYDSLIQWPTAEDAIDIDEFNDVGILDRALLQDWMDENNDPDAEVTPYNATLESVSGSRRLREEGKTTRRGPTNAMKKMGKAVSEMRDILKNMRESSEKIKNLHTDRLSRHLKAQSDNVINGMEVVDPSVMSSHRMLFSISTDKKFVEKLKDYISTAKTNSINRLREYVLDKTSVYNMASEYYDGLGYESLVRDDCGAMHSELMRMYDHVDLFVLDYQQKINDNAELTLEHITYTKDLQDELTKLEQFALAMSPVMPLVSKLPYAGRVAKIFYDLYVQLIKATVKPTNVVLARVNNRITNSGVPSKLSTIITKNEELATKIMTVRDLMLDKANDLVKVDAICPAVVGAVTSVSCASIQSALIAPNDQLDDFAADAAAMAEFLDQQMTPIFEIAVAFLESPVYAAVESILSVVSIGFDAINALLETKIKACVPLVCWRTKEVCESVQYPSGVKMCKKKVLGKKIKYACGTEYSYKTVCANVPEAYSCEQCAQFTIGDIIDGAMSTLEPLEEALTTIMENMAKALGIEFPEITIPGLPDTAKLSNLEDLIDDHINFEYPTALTTAMETYEDFLNTLSTVPSC